MKSKFLSTEFVIRTSPHVSRKMDVAKIMRHVFFATIPMALMAVYLFGLSALLLICCTIFFCIATERVVNLVNQEESTTGDFSAAITGMLLALTLPPTIPLWIAAVGGVVAILMGKTIFGGLGFNIFNPALVGRAFLQAAFPVEITTWSSTLSGSKWSALADSTLTLPFTKMAADVVSTATPLSLFKFDHQMTESSKLFFGMINGSAGETCALYILLVGIYLSARKMLDWRIPAGILISVALLSGIFYLVSPKVYPSPLFMLFSGGLMLGAVFMATDMVTSPLSTLGVWIYAVFIGVIIVFIRLFGGLPEGVMYAILLGNAITPIINQMTRTPVYGVQK